MKVSLLLLVTLACSACATHDITTESLLNGQLEREIAALNMRLEMVSAQQSGTMGADTDHFYALCQQIFMDSEATVTKIGSATHITLPANLLFSSGLRIRQEAKGTLDLVAHLLIDSPERQITIIGHTSSHYSDDHGMGSLSDWSTAFASAAAVLEVLANEFGLDPSRTTIATQGGASPIGSNDTPSGRIQNERVVIIVQ